MKRSSRQLDREIAHALRGKGISKREIALVAEEALDRFWASVAAAYPQAKTGDLSPGADIPLRRAAVAAVTEWVESNVP